LDIDQEYTKYIEEFEDLPTLDFIHQKVVAVVNDPTSSASDLNEIISKDPSLSSRILKLANSAYYGFPKSVTSLTQAVVILGFKTVKNLALSVMTYDKLFKNPRMGEKLKTLWFHAVNTAVVSEIVAETVGYPSKEDLFICGLLHDVGKNVLAMISPETVETILELSKKYRLPFYEVETKLEVPNHQNFGNVLCRKWNLPDVITLSVSFHHTPLEIGKNPNADVVYMVHVADVISNYIHPDQSWTGGLKIEEKAWNTLGLKPSAVRRIIKETKERMKNSKDFFEL